MKHLQSLAQKSVYWLKVITLGIVLGVGIQFAQAWTNPTQTPPGGNVSGPITTSGTGQIKAGNLALNAGGTYANALLIPNGNVGIGTLSPTTKLDVVGTIKTTGLQIPTGAAVNKVLTSDASGNATWAPVSATSIVSYNDLPRGAMAGLCLTDYEGAFQSAIEPGYYSGFNGGPNFSQCLCRGGFSLITLSVASSGYLRYSCIKN